VSIVKIAPLVPIFFRIILFALFGVSRPLKKFERSALLGFDSGKFSEYNAVSFLYAS
jgi:hypothetical protein